MQTVISVFENHQAAQRAQDRLLEAGFEPDDVHLRPGAASADMAGASMPAHPVLMVDAADDEAVDRAYTILHELGALDIDDHPGMPVFEQDSGRRLRDPARPDGMINRPAGTEGEVRVIDRGERERAMAANQPYDKREREVDIEAREAREARTKPSGE